MKHRIKKNWFSEPTRHSLASYVKSESDKNTTRVVDFSLYDETESDFSYKMSVFGAWQVVLQLIYYIGVDPNSRRPWLAHRVVSDPLELKQFKSYIDEVIGRLTSRPPSVNYPALVHVHTVINILTTMEYKDGK